MRKLLNEELGRPTLEECANIDKLPVTVILDNVRSAQNVGSFFRTADAFGIEHIALCGISSTPPNREIHKTALGAEMSVAWTYYPTTLECVEKLRAEGYRILAIEQIENSTMLNDFRAEEGVKYALVIMPSAVVLFIVLWIVSVIRRKKKASAQKDTKEENKTE